MNKQQQRHSTAISEARSTANSLLPAKPDCQSGESENSTATSMLPAKPDLLLPAKPDLVIPVKPDPLLKASSQGNQIVREVRVSIPLLQTCSQQSQIHCYQRSQIHH